MMNGENPHMQKPTGSIARRLATLAALTALAWCFCGGLLLVAVAAVRVFW